jgi:ABC-type transport system substrate-binding protein
MHKRPLLLLVLMLMLLAAIVPATGAQDSVFIRYPITSDPEHLNPFTAETIAISTVTRNIFEGLTRYNADTGDIEPSLAERWEITEEDGNQVFTFYLRQGVLFHQIDGVEYAEGEREVKASDIIWNYTTALSGDEAVSTKAGTLDAILGAAAYTAGEADTVEGLVEIDDYTLQIILEQPDRLFLINGMFSITSPVAYEQLGENINNRAVGTGPFQFVEWLRQDRLILEKNPDYWREEFPRVDGIRFINYGDANTALLDYRENQLDFLFAFPGGQRNAIIEEFPDDFNEKPGLHVRYWGFNMETGFLAENLLVRQALSHALDREVAWDIFAEGARFPATLGFLPPAMPASTPTTIYDFDLQRAAELLEEAGYPGGEGLPVIRIHLLESISGEAQVVVWQEALESLGVQVQFIVEDGGTYWDSIVQDDAMVFQNGWAAGLIDPSDVFDFLILDGRGSMRYDNPEVNELLRAARIELDEDRREALYQQVHDIVMADAVVIPSAYSKVTWLQKPWVEGFNPGGGGTYTAPLWEVSINTGLMP